MDLKELKALLDDYDLFEEWSFSYFKEYTKDDKFISPKDYENIITSICDELGTCIPTKDEVESMIRKKDEDYYAKTQGKMCMMKKIPFPKQGDDISFMEYNQKLSIIIEIIILRLSN